MKSPKNFKVNLERLKSLSIELNKMIECGDFYKLSFFKRYELIREVKRLYNKLLGSVSEVKLKYILAAVASLLIIGTACPTPAPTGSDGGNGGGIFKAPIQQTYLYAPGYFASPTFVDIDNDGDFDAFIGANSGNTLFFDNTGDNTNPDFKASKNINLNLVNTPSKFIDRRNLKEIIKQRIKRKISATKAPVVDPYLSLPYGCTSPSFADIDGDGDFDAFVGFSSYPYGSIYFFDNTGDKYVPDFSDYSAINPFNIQTAGYSYFFASPTLVDIDNDGDLDLFVGDYGYPYSTHVQFLENNGTNSFLTPTNIGLNLPYTNSYPIFNANYFLKPTFVDIDNDGDFDAFVGVNNIHYCANPYSFGYSGSILYFENTGTASSPSFAAPKVNPLGIKPVFYAAAPAFVDIDGDGDQDLFVGDAYGYIQFFENTTN